MAHLNQQDATYENRNYANTDARQKELKDKNKQLIRTMPQHHFETQHQYENFNESDSDEISIVLSIVYGILIVILAIVFKIAESITDKSHLASKEYQIALFVVAIVWLIFFKLYHTWLDRKCLVREEIKSPHASNRWLKGVVAIFGIAIIIKDSLEVIGTMEIDNPACNKHAVYLSNFILHALFIMGQVVLLFFYSKVHIQELKCVTRFGVMHILASNLAVWVSVIADETTHALHLKAGSVVNKEDSDMMDYEYYGGNYTKFVQSIESNCNSSSMLLDYFGKPNDSDSKGDYYDKKGGLFSGYCSCYTNVCYVIGRAEKFLTPLLVEYCLVSSCLLYIMWSHVGRDSRHHHEVAKPSHKFYKSYKGVVFGALMLVATVIEMTLLGTLDSGADKKTYYTESFHLLIYDSFLVAFNIAVLIACCLGFYVYYIAKLKKNNAGATLDIVLLFICVTGPLLVGIFSALGLSAGATQSKAPGWEVSLISALVDVIVSIVQVLFAVHGLNKEAGTLNNAQKRGEEKREKLKSSYLFQNSNANTIQSNNNPTVVETEVADTNEAGHSRGVSNPAAELEEDAPMPDPPMAVLNQRAENASVSKSTWSSFDLESKNSSPFQPAPIRILIRDIMTFLVMCNTCLYVFLSLSHGTVFSVYFYANEYFGHSAFTTLASVTAPFSIFLKLHLAACYFEIWTYS